jgi:hypothetical protein
MNTEPSTERGIDNQSTATVNTSSDGDTLGVCLFLGKADLDRLGVENADSIQYGVRDGELLIQEVTEG